MISAHQEEQILLEVASQEETVVTIIGISLLFKPLLMDFIAMAKAMNSSGLFSLPIILLAALKSLPELRNKLFLKESLAKVLNKTICSNSINFNILIKLKA